MICLTVKEKCWKNYTLNKIHLKNTNSFLISKQNQKNVFKI